MGTTRKRHPGGADVEQEAERWLRQQGIESMVANFNCRAGEIDLIGSDGDVLVFFEIRYRTPGGHGTAAESIDRRKQQKMIRAASYFLHSQPRYNTMPCRFDAVVSDARDDAGNYIFQWYKNAFTAD